MITRVLALIGLAAAVLAVLLLWASSRDLREPWAWPPPPEDEDGIQPPDPHLVHNVEAVPMDDWPDLGAFDYARPTAGM